MDALVALMSSGALNLLDLVLIAGMGVLLYIMTVRQKASDSDLHHTVEGLKTLLEEEHRTTDKLSKTVYQIRQEMEHEREEKWMLKEQILTLKAENERLKHVVADLEQIVKNLREENERLLDRLSKLSKGGEE